jgi:long-subunit fatty acid transport protein
MKNATYILQPACTALTLLLLFLPTNIATGQTGDDALRFSDRFPASTARSIGMAGVGIAGISDATALLVNPAGLGLARSSSASGSFTSIVTNDDALYRLGGGVSPSEMDVSRSDLGSLSYIYKLPTSQGSLVFAASLTQTNTFERSLFFEGVNNLNSITDFFMPLPGEFDLQSDDSGVFPTFTRTPSFIAFETFAIDLDQGLIDTGDAVPFLPAVSAGSVIQSGSVIEQGRMHELNFGGALEASKGILVGASVNIPFGRYSFTRIHEEDDFQNDNDGTGGTTDFQFLRFTESFSSRIVGVSVRGGISAEVTPQLRLGLTLESPTYLTVTDNFQSVLSTAFDNGDTFTYGDDRDENAGNGTFDYDITTPWHLGAGLSFSQDGFTVSADAEWTDWSQLELGSTTVSFDGENRRIAQQFDAVINTRLGVSYERGKYTLRGGFARYPDAHDASFASLQDGYRNKDRTYYSAGLGYKMSDNLRADVGWMHEQFDDTFRPYTEVLDAPTVAESVSRDRVQLGITFLF